MSYIVDCLNNCLDTIDCNSALNVDPELPLADADLVSLTLDLLEQKYYFLGIISTISVTMCVLTYGSKLALSS